MEFINDLINNVENLFNIAKFKINYTIASLNNKCNYVCKQEENCLTLTISIKEIINKHVSMQNLIHINLVTKNRVEGRCEECKHNYLLHKTEAHTFGNILLIQLELFKQEAETFIKINDNYKIKGVSADIYNIEGSKFKVISAMIHYGKTISEGHYTSMIRTGKCWMEANDSYTNKKNWPRNSKNVYVLLLLEKIK